MVVLDDRVVLEGGPADALVAKRRRLAAIAELGLARTQLAGYLVASAYNLVRMARLFVQPVGV